MTNSVEPFATATPAVCVVDGCGDDYRDWFDQAAAGRVRLTVLATPAEALRRSREGAVDLWVINTTLPGISGAELCAMLKSQSSHAAICLISDDYSPAVERTAWAARASMFLCKGAHANWLAEWLDGQFRQADCRMQSNQVARRAMPPVGRSLQRIL